MVLILFAPPYNCIQNGEILAIMYAFIWFRDVQVF